jgi:glutamate synthase domain-containing protein 2
MSKTIYSIMAALTAAVVLGGLLWGWVWWLLVLVLPAWVLAMQDSQQSEHSLRRNFPLVGRARWLAEFVRPFVRQYFMESETDGAPISRMFRSIVYQRAKGDLETVPYGTKVDVYRDGYEWLGHSLGAHTVREADLDCRVEIGGPDCRQKYSASLLNISAMSYGSLSSAALTALNKGAKAGGFYHNTGEGGLSPYHLQGADVVWQIGTGYFGCRTKEGGFNPEFFKEKVAHPNVKMIEIKLSQGAKPGHGGILPASKNTADIAKIRTVEVGTEVISPSTHREFNSPVGLLEFVKTLRELSEGKPVGFKLCVGRPAEFLGICQAMIETGIKPDFITVDGGEGGTGAAPLEYSNSVGMPLREGIAFVDDCLTGFGVRGDIRIIASAKVFTGFHMAKNLAVGADLCNSARGMMLALGCVQSLICHTNHCPTGIATQDPDLVKGLVVEDKWQRVQRFHAETMRAFIDLMSSAGLRSARDLTRAHIFRRCGQDSIKRYDQIFKHVTNGALLTGDWPEPYRNLQQAIVTDRFC